MNSKSETYFTSSVNILRLEFSKNKKTILYLCKLTSASHILVIYGVFDFYLVKKTNYFDIYMYCVIVTSTRQFNNFIYT